MLFSSFNLKKCAFAFLMSLFLSAGAAAEQSIAGQESSVSQLRRIILEQTEQINNLRNAVQQIIGDNEMLLHRQGEANQRQEALYNDLDKRLSQLEEQVAKLAAAALAPTAEVISSAPSAASPESTDIMAIPTPALPAIAGMSGMSGMTAKPVPPLSAMTGTSGMSGMTAEPVSPPTRTATLTPPADAMSSMAGTTMSPSQPAQPELSPAQQEAAIYQQASQALRVGEYDTAISHLQTLLQHFPQGQYADNAQYWLGECYYAKKDFQSALTNFDALLKKYPDSLKRSHALLKMGYTYYELRDYRQARQILEQVRETYPNGATARLAEERLQRLSQEGQ